ncbi:MAG: glutamate--tRNA ligase [Actinobacteria bacterium]|uniref:glutamate--tRNA ligase n=1 Tax=freshwater metagenome TaxID=449393 RepID=A0A6J7AQJ2_9ZZZZ|nr:glutamate--tRNA ligase [Actinomycetota bacterium]MSX87860.1 glutamate--tRNA ligase [Actinomycetota bacterium]
MIDRPVRVRFAPSPTGYFHVGGAKTSLYNWIFARQSNGVFVLRIEDTDAERNKPEWIEGIQSAMQWLVSGLDSPAWDEGPYFQSHNAPKHLEAAATLFAAGRAYYCDCTRDDVKERTGSEHAGYDGHCRTRGLEAAPGHALRFRTPDEGVTVVVDVIRGNPEFPNGHLEDFIILRGNGSPMFLLANVVDDIDMGITHVVRAEEHLSNTPKAQLLWEALDGGPLPVFAHVPLLVNEKRQKLSKRRDPVALEMYRDQGFLPEAMRNFLMLLGWSPAGDDEIVPWSRVMADFRLEDVNSSPAYFDVQKLTAINGEYIRALPVEEFIERCAPWVPDEWRTSEVFTAMAPLVQERVKRLDEVPEMIDFLFRDDVPFDEQSWNKAMKAPADAILDGVIDAYETCAWDAASLKLAAEAVGERHGLKPSKAQAPVRVAVTGRTVGPPLYDSVAVLGRERTLARLRAARARLA